MQRLFNQINSVFKPEVSLLDFIILPAILTDVIRNCAYRKACRDDVVIKQGDTGDRLVYLQYTTYFR